MRLSSVIELLLILLLIAFAAYGRVIERNQTEQRAIRDAANGSKQSNTGISTLSLKQATDSVNKYCTCNENICNCCRDFHIPLVQLQGPGCASLQYLQGDNLAVQLSFGDNILTSAIVNGKSPKPVCVPLPGGFTKFCGRLYSIQRDAKNHFKACLGLELQSSTELEASLRVSCFRFGPDGLKLRPAEPLPIVEQEAADDDDDDDFFGLGSDDDEDDDETDEDAPLANSVPNSSAEEDEDEDDDEDVLGFGALLDIITGEDEPTTKKPKVTTAAPLLQFTIPLLTRPTSVPPLEPYEASTAGNSVDDGSEEDEYNQSSSVEEDGSTENDANDANDSTVTDTTANEAEEIATETSNKIALYAKPAKAPTKKLTVSDASKKKPSITSTSINAIENDTNKKKKPLRKPVKVEDEDVDDLLGDDDLDDDDDEDEELLDDDDDERDEVEGDDDEKEHESNEDDDEKAEEIEDLDDDDDDDEEDAVISALVYDEKEDGKKRKVKKNHPTSDEDDDSDYGLGLPGLLARSRHSRNGRQSKVMRL